jgi:hypothetical protein
LDEVQASNSIKWGQREPAPPWMDGVWTVYGQDSFFRWVLVPPAKLPMAAGFKQDFGWPENRQTEGGALLRPAAHQPLGLDQCWAGIIFLRYPLDQISIFFFFFFF